MSAPIDISEPLQSLRVNDEQLRGVAPYASAETMRGVAPYASAETIQNNMEAACAITVRGGRGSGSLVDGRPLGLPRYCVLTNHHVIGTEADAEHATAVFNKLASNPGSWITIKLDPRAGFAARCSRPLDYCFVAVLTEDVPKLKCTPISLAHATSKPSADITITIWQHPQGGVKVMSNFHVEKMTDEGSISYQNDTEPGSSGSPIFDNVGRLVGIHAQGGSDANSGCLLFSIVNAVKADSAEALRRAMSMGGTDVDTLKRLYDAAVALNVDANLLGQAEVKLDALRAAKRKATEKADSALMAIARAGGIEPLVALARGGTDGQKQWAARALNNLAVNADNKVAIAKAGGIAPLVALARGGTDEQKEEAAGALGNLAVNTDNQVAIAKAGGIAPLVALARGGTDGQKEEAAAALGWLACNTDNKVAIQKAGWR